MNKPLHWMRLTALSCALVLAGCSASPGGQVRGATPSLAPQDDPRDDRGMYLDLIRKMQEQGAWYASLAHIDAHRQRFDASPELRLLQAHALRETGQDSQARALYDALLTGPHAAAASHGLGLIAARIGDDAAAVDHFTKAARLAPLDRDYLGDLGFVLLRAGRIDEARVPLAKAAELAPDNARSVSNLALWALLAGQPAQAESMMQRARLSPDSRGEVYRLAQQLRRPPAATNTTPTSARTIASATPASHSLAATPPRMTLDAPIGSTLPMPLMDRFHGTPAKHTQDTPR